VVFHEQPEGGDTTVADQQRYEPPADPDPLRKGEAEPTGPEVTDAICADILAIHRNSYGRGAERVQAHVLDDTVVVLLDGLELLPNEEFLIEHDRVEPVTNLRELFHKAIEPTFRAAVERATGRRVVGFTSHFEFSEPPFAVEIFRLEPR
jgi:uncharacterized protein YbcI